MKLVTIFKCPKFDEIQKKRDEFEERICIKKYSTTPSAINLDGYPTCETCINYNLCLIKIDTDVVNTPDKMHEAMDEIIASYYRRKNEEEEAEDTRKTCKICKYDEYSINTEPCISCRRDYLDKWEPKEVQDES